ncbi:MAG: arginyl-tRNA synthetase, partial [Bacteroidia bacterium]
MSSNFISKLKQSVSAAFEDLYAHQISTSEVKIETTNPSFAGSFTFVVFPYLRVTNSKPEDCAAAIGSFITSQLEEVNAFNVVKGFLNFELTDAFWLSYLSHLQLSDRLGETTPNPEKIMVEYSSPNTNKPLHLGHVRNNLLGYS